MLKYLGENKVGAMVLIAAMVVIFGCALLMVGLYLSGTATIAAGVLVATGECFVFAGTIFGINYSYKERFTSLRNELYKELNKNNISTKE